MRKPRPAFALNARAHTGIESEVSRPLARWLSDGATSSENWTDLEIEEPYVTCTLPESGKSIPRTLTVADVRQLERMHAFFEDIPDTRCHVRGCSQKTE